MVGVVVMEVAMDFKPFWYIAAFICFVGMLVFVADKYLGLICG
jgi:hypothetical protein